MLNKLWLHERNSVDETEDIIDALRRALPTPQTALEARQNHGILTTVRGILQDDGAVTLLHDAIPEFGEDPQPFLDAVAELAGASIFAAKPLFSKKVPQTEVEKINVS